MPVNKKDIIPERYDKKLKECFQPTEVLMADLCNRWSLKVLYTLEASETPMRFNEIRKASGSTSDKMMTQALKSLQGYKLICFTEDKQSLGYSLTQRGRSLLDALHPLEKWVDDLKTDFAKELRMKNVSDKKKTLESEKEALNQRRKELQAQCDLEPFEGYQNPKLVLFDAEQGDVDAMYFLGVLYETGDDEPKQDYAKAMEWYRKAASKNDTNSMCAIAKLYEEGKGVEKNMNEARKWMQKAAQLNDDNARQWLEEHDNRE